MKKSFKLPARELFAKNLRRSRRAQNVSQIELATRAGLSNTYISDIERSMRNVSIDNMELLANSLGVALMDLLNPELFSSVVR